jgi:hypothetical protein
LATLIVIEELAGGAVVGRGGQATRVLQHLHGFERLGHRPIFLEFLREDPGSDTERMVKYFGDTVEHWWHPDQSALICEDNLRSLYGLTLSDVVRVASEAAAVVTLMATYHPEPYPLIDHVRPRILYEVDPAYTQLWAEGGDPQEVFGQHDLYHTVGMNIGTPRCSVPTLGIDWRHLWNPVLLSWWPERPQTARDRFTTVADWRAYGYLEFEGRILGPKAEEFRKFAELPRLAGEPIELALTIDPEDPDIEYFERRGWKIEGAEIVGDAGRFRDYISGSIGEFSCAKGGYVGTHCGWFSERSAYYLACGRPVVVQATGFEDLLPTGRGLFAVSAVEEAAEAIQAIRRDYRLHSAAARSIAAEYFDSDRLLPRLLGGLDA